MKLQFKPLTATAIIPIKAHETDVGFDVCVDEYRYIPKNTKHVLSTGIAMAIPEGYYGRLVGRSSINSKTPLTVLEGVIDSDYRGEVKIMVHTFSGVDVPIKKGDRIAQLIIQPVINVEPEVVDTLSTTVRGEGGFGSTGTSL